MQKHSYDERDIFIRGKNVLLKALTEEDVRESGWYGWFNDEQTTHFLDHHYFPNTLSSQLQFWQSLQSTPNKLQLGIMTTDSERIIGVVSLNSISSFHRTAEISIVIGDNSYRGRNVGLETIALILKHGFLKLNLNRIWMGQDAGLHKWVKTLTDNLGFREEGVLREAFYHHGRYNDVVLIGVLRRDFVRALNTNEEISTAIGYVSGTLAE